MRRVVVVVLQDLFTGKCLDVLRALHETGCIGIARPQLEAMWPQTCVALLFAGVWSPACCAPVAWSLGKVVGKPVNTLVVTGARRGTGCLDAPLVRVHIDEAQLVRHLGHRHGLGQVLLVGKHHHHGVAQVVLRQHGVQLVACLCDVLVVGRVDNKDEAVCVVQVVLPHRMGGVMAAHIPHVKAGVVVVHDRVHVEADGWGVSSRSRPASA